MGVQEATNIPEYMCKDFFIQVLRSFAFIKNGLVCLFLGVLISLNVKPESFLPGGFNHVIEVTRYSDYGKGYLTITDDNSIYILENGHITYWISCTFDYVDEQNEYLSNGDLILEVDGISAAGWSKEQFYSTVNNRNDTITLKIRSTSSKNENAGIYEFETKIHPRNELPEKLKVFGNQFAYILGETASERRKDIKFTYEERHDEDFDFFPCLYYDYLITSDDPLLDKEILKQVGWGRLERNEENPDLLITIARNANESISTTYIPPSNRVVNEGSTTRAQYNYILKQNDYITTQKNRVIREGGYTQETKTADIYLEIAALDVKKLNDKSSTHPPIVWKTTAKRHVVNPNFNLNEELKAYASWMRLPLFDRFVCAERKVYAPTGIICSETDPSIVQEVIKGSRAENVGFQSGDKIIKAEFESRFANKYANKSIKKNGWRTLNNYNDDTFFVVFLRNGNKMRFAFSPSSIEVERLYLE